MQPATFLVARSLLSASSSPGNAYLAGLSVVRTAPVAGDLSLLGGSVSVAAPVAGDGLIIAGSARIRAPIRGDLRAVGANLTIDETVGGDITAFGYEVRDSSRPGGNVFIVAANITLQNGAGGPVIVYGNNISLAGDFEDNVTIVATGRVALLASTTIRGALTYEAPEPALIPASATIQGGVTYTNVSYLPDVGTSRALAFMSIGFFLLVRIVGALILASLLAGLFPRLAETVAFRAHTSGSRDVLLATLLGFAIMVATPVLILLLALTFVGMGLALLLLVVYFLLALLALLYAGILIGSILVRRYAKREVVRWHDGTLGMLVLSLVSLVPFIGLFIVVLLFLFTAGTMLLIFFQYAFAREEDPPLS